MTKNPTDAKNMGGPSFHPELKKQKAPVKGASTKALADDGAILKKDQVPPL